MHRHRELTLLPWYLTRHPCFHPFLTYTFIFPFEHILISLLCSKHLRRQKWPLGIQKIQKYVHESFVGGALYVVYYIFAYVPINEHFELSDILLNLSKANCPLVIIQSLTSAYPTVASTLETGIMGFHELSFDLDLTWI